MCDICLKKRAGKSGTRTTAKVALAAPVHGPTLRGPASNGSRRLPRAEIGKRSPRRDNPVPYHPAKCWEEWNPVPYILSSKMLGRVDPIKN